MSRAERILGTAAVYAAMAAMLAVGIVASAASAVERGLRRVGGARAR